MKREQIFLLIAKERERQDKRWGRDFPERPASYWLGILVEELGEVAKAVIEGKPMHVKNELIHTAAVIFSWLELGEALADKKRM